MHLVSITKDDLSAIIGEKCNIKSQASCNKGYYMMPDSLYYISHLLGLEVPVV